MGEMSRYQQSFYFAADPDPDPGIFNAIFTIETIL